MRFHTLLVCAVLLPLSVKAQQTRETSPYIDLVFCPAKEQPWSCARLQSGRILDLWNDQLDSEWQKLKVEADQQLNATLERRGYSTSEPLTKEKPSTILKKIEIGTNYVKDYLSETFDGFLGREYDYYGYGAVQENEEPASDEFVDVEGESKKGSKKKKKKKKKRKKKKRKKKKGHHNDEGYYDDNHRKKGHKGQQELQHVTPPTILLLQSPALAGHTSGVNVHDFHQQQQWHDEPKPQQVFVLQENDDDHGGGHGGHGHGGKKKKKRRKKLKKKKKPQSTFTAIPALLGSKPSIGSSSLLLHEPEEYQDHEHEHSALSILGSLVGDFLEDDDDDDDDEHGYVVVKQKRKKKRKRKKKKHKKRIKYVTRGKKKKKKKNIMKLVLLGTFLKAKIELLLKILGAHLQVKFFAIALVGLLINIVRFWIDLKRGGAPQKVVYVEHAHHQHHYEDHGDDWGEQGGGGYWKRSIQTDPTLEQSSETIGSYHVPAYEPQYMAYRSYPQLL